MQRSVEQSESKLVSLKLNRLHVDSTCANYALNPLIDKAFAHYPERLPVIRAVHNFAVRLRESISIYDYSFGNLNRVRITLPFGDQDRDEASWFIAQEITDLKNFIPGETLDPETSDVSNESYDKSTKTVSLARTSIPGLFLVATLYQSEGRDTREEYEIIGFNNIPENKQHYFEPEVLSDIL